MSFKIPNKKFNKNIEMKFSDFGYANLTRLLREAKYGNFCYKQSKQANYIAGTLNKKSAFMGVEYLSQTLNESDLNPPTKGWKFHISVDDTKPCNLEKAWDLIVNVLIPLDVEKFKVCKPNIHLSWDDDSQRGKQITIYDYQNKFAKTLEHLNISKKKYINTIGFEDIKILTFVGSGANSKKTDNFSGIGIDFCAFCKRKYPHYFVRILKGRAAFWNNVFRKITKLFVKHKIKPSFRSPNDMYIKGSSYFGCRDDSKRTRYDKFQCNEKENPFAKIDLSDIINQPKVPTSPNELSEKNNQILKSNNLLNNK